MKLAERAGILILSMATLVLFQNCGKKVDLGDYEQSSTAIPVEVTNIIPPTITAKSPDQSITVGSNVGMSVDAAGTDLAYQWAKDGVQIPGATSSLYTIMNADVTNAGRYTVFVGNSAGSVSADINIVVNPVVVVDTSPPSITVTQADHKVVYARIGFSPNILTLSVGTTKATSFQWFFQKKGTVGFVLIPGATTALYTTAVTLDTLGTYQVVVSNAYGSVSDDTVIYF